MNLRSQLTERIARLPAPVTKDPVIERDLPVFVRLCDVDEKGRSSNMCDGLTGLTGADKISRARVQL